MITRAARIVYDRWQLSADPVAYARRLGVTVGERCWLVGLDRKTFGTEPYLITLGERVAVAQEVRFVTHDGGAWVFRDEMPNLDVVGRISVGDHTLLGMGAILLPGTEIGARCIVAAGAVVRGTVPDGTVVAGIPAKPVMSIEDYRRSVVKRGIHVRDRPLAERQRLYVQFLDGEVDNRGEPISR